MSTTYTLSAPLTGMTAYNASSFQVKADATASSYAFNTTGKLYLGGEFAATMAGVTLNLNAPPVLSISARMTFKAEWKEGEFQFSGTVAEQEAAKNKSAMQKTKSAISHLKNKAAALDSKVTQLGNHADTLHLYGTLMEA